eukprot:TRINITY_DN17574_c0_g2_i2.p1 TRINITY_DN17574_c0_g2~~TRINITY_DN17574_c0_g2_i2.p1  ORF type:complete len:303 (+),score=33.34 TRINITY_DN17574_c0_g2_i2:216-1124(+)
MRNTKEKRIIEYSEEIAKELKKVYLEGIGIDEYQKLLNEYKKLFKRYEKTIKLSDNLGNSIMEQNDNLSDTLHYTISKARNKLQENVEEHKKTKLVSINYKEKIIEYQKALTETVNEKIRLQKKLNIYLKNFGEIKHQFDEKILEENDFKSLKEKVNPKNYSNLDIKKLLFIEVKKNNTPQTLVKLKLNRFEEIIDIVKQSSSLESFFKNIYKFIENNFNNEIIVFYEEPVYFYLLLNNKTTNDISKQLVTLNNKRNIYNHEIYFTIAGTTFNKENDTIDTFLDRCDKAFEEAVKTNNIVLI